MSSEIATVLESLVLNNGVSVATVTLAVYDYLLTFSSEIEYIWCKPWTWVSTMFVIIRYIGLCWVITLALDGTSFVPGPLKMFVHKFTCTYDLEMSCEYFKGTAMYLIPGWAYILFLSVTDLVMILRVYAMWSQSRMILFILLFIYIPQCVVSVVLDGIYNNPNTYLTTTIIQVLDFSLCNNSSTGGPPTVQVYLAAPRLALSAALIIFALLRTTRESFEMYKATKKWQPNHYMQRLVGDGILYFLINVLYQTNDLLIVTGQFQSAYNTFLVLETLAAAVFYIIIPRFVIGIRELYDRDTRGRLHVDSGFGAVSQFNAAQDATISALVFMDGYQCPEVEGGTDDSTDPELGRVHGLGSSM